MVREEPAMEITAVENSKSSTLSSIDVEQQSENTAPQLLNHDDTEPKYDITAEEVRSIMEIIATTGKFWHDWDMLKSMLSFRLKQVLAEYPESQMVGGDGSQQSSFSGETYPELVKRLDEALLCFVEGPPFTLQRLCEILLTPKSTYRSLSKLALALEKNLLVTSTLTICTDPYPTASVQEQEEPEKRSEEEPQEPEGHVDAVPNGAADTTPPIAAVDADEEMAEAEADEDAMNTDTEMREEKAGEVPESKREPSPEPEPLGELCNQ